MHFDENRHIPQFVAEMMLKKATSEASRNPLQKLAC